MENIGNALINSEINLQLKWFKNFIVIAGTAANQKPKFEITDTKLYHLKMKMVKKFTSNIIFQMWK